MSNSTVTSTRISTASMLGILFIGLKLTNYIDWSWWWVLSPFYLPLVIGVSLIVFIFLIALLPALFELIVKKYGRE